MIREFHTTDLTSQCMYHVKLRHEGKVIRQTSGALYSGHMFHSLAEAMHEECKDWSDPSQLAWWIAECKDRVFAECEDKLQSEMSPLTDSVKKRRDELLAEVEEWAINYVERFASYFSTCKWIATEVPMRATLVDFDGEEVNLATHCDLCLIDKVGQLRIWDWKTGADTPDMEYLGRNLQFGLMYLCVSEGILMLDKEFQIWTNIQQMPVMGWIDVRRMGPYKRGGTTKDGRSYKKGDIRPFENICKQWTFSPTQEHEMKNEILQRVKMDKLGIYPKNPTITGCLVCSGNRFCDSYARDNGP